jgi:hypothetical protein
MTEFDRAQQMFLSLKQAEQAEPQAALLVLNGLIGLTRDSDGEPSLEIGEARSAAFLAICEIGKALHRGQPAGHLWAPAIEATAKWMSLIGPA